MARDSQIPTSLEGRVPTTFNELEAIVEAVSALIACQDAQGRFVRVNRAFCEAYGLEPQQLIGQTPEQVAPAFGEMLAGADELGEAIAPIATAGGQRWFRWTQRPLHGAAAWTLAWGEDVTERRRAQVLEELLRAIDGWSLAGESLNAILANLTERIVALLPYPLAYFAMKEADGAVRVHTHAGCSAYVEGIELRWDESPAGCGPTGLCLRSGQPHVASLDDPNFTLWRERAIESGLMSTVSLPLRERGEVRGCLSLYAREADAFGPAVLRQLEKLAERLSVALTMAGHQQQLRLQGAAMEAAANGIFILDREGQIEWANPALTELTGLAAEELVGRQPSFLNSPSHGPAFWREIMETVRAGRTWRDDFVLVHQDETQRTVRATLTPLEDPQGRLPYVIAILQDITEEKVAKQRIQHMALHDALTDLPNRTMFHSRLQQALAQAARTGRLVALHFLDLDHFKYINDTHGHAVGDEFLKAVALRMRASIRETDTLTRLGGDEFAIIQTNLQTSDEAAVMASKLLGLLEDSFLVAGHPFRTSGSVGVSLFPADGDEPERLLQHADLALYKAKAMGRNNFQFFSPDLNEAAHRRLRLENDLRQAVVRQEFLLHYQPRVDLASGEVNGMEALIRWKHPQLGMVSPMEFIPVAEETGLIIPIGEWVLAEACRQTRAWIDAGLPALRVAVNLSAAQLNQEAFVKMVDDTLTATGLSADLLELELTESLLMRGKDDVLTMLNNLRALGVTLSIDDFGTGYSSLSYLSRFPVQILKIDQSFTRTALNSPADAAIVRAVVALGHSLGMTVLAEGVETVEQLQFLRAEGCDEIQGYYFSRPVHPDDFPAVVPKRLEP